MSANGTELTPQQQRAIGALLTARNQREAAAQAKVQERTLYRWLQEPAFKAALSQAEGHLIDSATRRLLRLQEKAIGTVEDILGAELMRPEHRLRAATIVLDYLLKLRELRSIEERLAALEATIGNNK